MKNENLDRFVDNYSSLGDCMDAATEYCGKIFRRHMNEGSVLELGPAHGVMTQLLNRYYKDYTVVDGSKIWIQELKKKLPEVVCYNCYFEEFSPTRKYDNIILGHVLEHVDDPVQILKLCKTWLNVDGHILSAVPNAHSLHRQAAVKMGLLQSEDQLNDTDRSIGHKRVYNWDMMRTHVENAGLSVVKMGGYWLKPLSNAQINRSWDTQMVDAFLELGELYPEISAEIYVVAEKGIDR